MHFADAIPSLPQNTDALPSQLQIIFLTCAESLELSFQTPTNCHVSALPDFKNLLEIVRFKKIDAIFIDLDFLEQETLQFLRRRPYQKILNEIPVIVFSRNSQFNLGEFLKTGIDDYYIGPLDSDLFTLRFKNFIKLHCPVLQNSQKMDEGHVELAFMAYYDKLTTLPNRQLFQERVENRIRSSGFEAFSFTIFFLDLDGFKLINDLNGHEAGDWLLNQVGIRLKNCLKKSDTIARLGGDEFAILIDGLDDRALTENIAHRILYRLSTPYSYNSLSLKINVSIGIAMFPEHGKTYQVLINQADRAMYKAKKEGKGRFAFAY